MGEGFCFVLCCLLVSTSQEDSSVSISGKGQLKCNITMPLNISKILCGK